MTKMLAALMLLAITGTAVAGEPKIVETADKVVVEFTGNGDGVPEVAAKGAPVETVTSPTVTDADTPPKGYLARKKWLKQRKAAQEQAVEQAQ